MSSRCHNSEIRSLSFRLVKRFPQVPVIVLSATSEKQLEDSIKRFAAKENPPIEKHRLAIACTIDVIQFTQIPQTSSKFEQR